MMSDAPGLGTAQFRQVLGHFPTGVVVVTALADGVPVLTADHTAIYRLGGT